ncbi:hypothetical protein QFC19_009280 [Naganishia cerealis]|uniref:Uncharacterized protein n=1 Tax=Naganishia cerealis TaxID=610337 RepID=A0ACC2UVJ1_9TREE|nr:hypothetical protein QFC19_009280 [Naganishia cerealis]
MSNELPEPRYVINGWERCLVSSNALQEPIGMLLTPPLHVIMSFSDTSPDLVADLHDVFNMLYPPSPGSAVSDEEGDADEGTYSHDSRTAAAADVVDLDGPVNGLAPLDVHEQRSRATDNGHPTGAQAEKHSRVESLLDKLSRKRIRALLDTTLPLIGHAASTLDVKSTKKRKLIQLVDPDIEIPRGMQRSAPSDLLGRVVSIWQRYLGNHGDAKRDRQRSMPSRNSASTKPTTQYSPFSTVSYLSRLQTFTLPTYPTKPSPLISPQACAQAGWINHGGKDRLVCEVCHKAWRVQLPSKELTGGITLSTEMKLKYIQLLAKQLVLAHTPSCPWRIAESLVSPVATMSSHLAPLAFDVETNILARGETPSIAHFEEADIELVSPLDATQVDRLTENLNQALESDLEPGPSTTSGEETVDAQAGLSKRNHASSSSPISSTAAILAFFGWNVFRPQEPSPSFNSEHSAGAGDSAANSSVIVPDVLRCRICDRKLGIWSFRHHSQSQQTGQAKATARALNVIREHREFCPIRTLTAGEADKDKTVRQSWWMDAVILQESLTAGGEGDGTDRRAQLPASSADAQVPEKEHGAVENVITELKDFTRVDTP